MEAEAFFTAAFFTTALTSPVPTVFATAGFLAIGLIAAFFATTFLAVDAAASLAAGFLVINFLAAGLAAVFATTFLAADFTAGLVAVFFAAGLPAAFFATTFLTAGFSADLVVVFFAAGLLAVFFIVATDIPFQGCQLELSLTACYSECQRSIDHMSQNTDQMHASNRNVNDLVFLDLVESIWRPFILFLSNIRQGPTHYYHDLFFYLGRFRLDFKDDLISCDDLDYHAQKASA